MEKKSFVQIAKNPQILKFPTILALKAREL
mgnify:FL=1